MDNYKKTLQDNYLEALNQPINEEITEITQTQFISKYETDKSWAIGPFAKNDTYTFVKSTQMADPTGIGWTSSSIFNPSTIIKDEKIYLYYRASVKKESLGSRVGLAIYTDGQGWEDYAENPILFPTQENEILSVEDPKVYKYGEDQYIMFYNGAWRASAESVAEYAKPFGDVACDINYALSSDLLHWEKKGLAVPYEISKLWAKGAVIPRNGQGEAVKINGEYLMFLSEGCGGFQYVGHSTNMIDWSFEKKEYLPLPDGFGKHIYEIACAIVNGDQLVMDFLYNDNNGHHAGAQALFDLSNPYTPLDFTHNATLAWGGMLEYRGEWFFAQGWDAPRGKEEMFFYSGGNPASQSLS